MAQDSIPVEIAEAGLDGWYATLNDPTKVKLRRYLSGMDTSLPETFLTQLMERTTADHNYGLAVIAGQYALTMDLDDYTRFNITNGLIEGFFGADMYEEAREACCSNLDLFPAVRDRIMEENGGDIPKNLACRNRIIDILVGVDGEYDKAISLLDDFAEIGIMDRDELEYRKQSLKIHRLQKSFDNLFIYRPKQ